MTGRVEGKVAFITGAARGQGRAHAVRLAQEGADIIAIDICKPIAGFLMPPSTPEDLAKTADLVKGHNRRIVTAEIDVRDYQALKAAVDSAVQQLGRLDVVVGLMRTLAVELGQHVIRVNSVHPTHVNTPMVMNEGAYKMVRPDLENPGPDDVAPFFQMSHMLPIPWVEPEDISNAVLFFAHRRKDTHRAPTRSQSAGEEQLGR